MALEEHLDSRNDDLVTAAPIGEHTHLVIQFAVAIDADRDADLVLGEEIESSSLSKRRNILTLLGTVSIVTVSDGDAGRIAGGPFRVSAMLI